MTDNIDIRACIQKIPASHQLEFDNIHSTDHSDSDRKILKAAFFAKKLWPKNHFSVSTFKPPRGSKIKKKS